MFTVQKNFSSLKFVATFPPNAKMLRKAPKMKKIPFGYIMGWGFLN